MSQMIYPYILLKKSHYVFSNFFKKCLFSYILSHVLSHSIDITHIIYMTHMLKLIFKTYKKNY